MTTEFKKKIFDIQSEIGKISKDSTNPFYKSKYFDINKLIEQLHPLLVKNKVILLQPIRDNKVFSEIIDLESESMISSFIELTGIKDPQKVGIEITYFRRYTLTSLLGLQAEDEDGNVGKSPNTPQVPIKKELTKVNTKGWENAIIALKEGKGINVIKERYTLSAENEKLLMDESK